MPRMTYAQLGAECAPPPPALDYSFVHTCESVKALYPSIGSHIIENNSY